VNDPQTGAVYVDTAMCIGSNPREHIECVEALGYCPYCQPSTFYAESEKKDG
jgi:hypothetical protein